MPLLLTVDPAKAERLIQRFRIGDGRFSRTLLEDTQPNPIGLTMIRSEPFPKFWG
jgi:hypothetical protein